MVYRNKHCTSKVDFLLHQFDHSRHAKADNMAEVFFQQVQDVINDVIYFQTVHLVRLKQLVICGHFWLALSCTILGNFKLLKSKFLKRCKN